MAFLALRFFFFVRVHVGADETLCVAAPVFMHVADTMPLDDVRQVFGGAASSRGAAGRLSHRPLVLVVEDEHDTADLIAEVLRENGCDVIVRGDGASALEAIRELPAPDLVLLDLELPGMSGRDVLNEVKRDVSLSWIPVVVVSAAPDAKHVYATDHVAKSELLRGLERVIARFFREPSPVAA